MSGHVELVQRKRGPRYYVKYRLTDGRHDGGLKSPAGPVDDATLEDFEAIWKLALAQPRERGRDEHRRAERGEPIPDSGWALVEPVVVV